MDVKSLIKSQLSEIGFEILSITKNESGGRNPSYSVLLTDGDELFVKILGISASPNIDDKYRNSELEVCQFILDETHAHVLPVAPLYEIQLDGLPARRILVYPLIDGHSIAQELHSGHLTQLQLSETVGRFSEFSNQLTQLPKREHFRQKSYLVLENLVRLSNSISIDALQFLSLTEMDYVRLLQNNTEIGRAAGSMINSLKSGPQSLSHGDIRLDQLLVGHGGEFLIDWEEAGIRNKGYDVLCLIADIFFNSFYRSVEGSLSEFSIDSTDAYYQSIFESSLQQAATNWHKSLVRFQELQELEQLLLPFISLYCFDRLMAISSKTPRLDVIGMSICGIALEILNRLDEFNQYFCQELLGSLHE